MRFRSSGVTLQPPENRLDNGEEEEISKSRENFCRVSDSVGWHPAEFVDFSRSLISLRIQNPHDIPQKTRDRVRQPETACCALHH